MADKKITELSQLGIADSADLFVLVDVSAYETKNITVSNLMGSPGPIGDNNADSGKFTTLQLLSGVSINEISSDTTLGGNSNLAVPTENAVKTYIDNAITSIVTDHNDLNNIQGGSLNEYYHLSNERYTFLSTLTNNHNDSLDIQGGNPSLNEYYHLSNERYTFLSTLTNNHNDLFNLQGGNPSLNEYYHLSNERYTFLSTLTNNHNDLFNLQGGDSTASNYYHLSKVIYDNLFSSSLTSIGIGDNSNTNINLNTSLNTISGFINGSQEIILDINGFALKDGVSVNKISNDGNFLNNSVTSLVTERAIKTYIDLNSGGSSNDIVVRISSDSTAVARNVLLVNTITGDVNIKMHDTLNGRITIKKISNDLNKVIITSTKNIDGLSQYIINTPNQSYNFLVDSGDFFVI